MPSPAIVVRGLRDPGDYPTGYAHDQGSCRRVDLVVELVIEDIDVAVHGETDDVEKCEDTGCETSAGYDHTQPEHVVLKLHAYNGPWNKRLTLIKRLICTVLIELTTHQNRIGHTAPNMHLKVLAIITHSQNASGIQLSLQ